MLCIRQHMRCAHVIIRFSSINSEERGRKADWRPGCQCGKRQRIRLVFPHLSAPPGQPPELRWCQVLPKLGLLPQYRSQTYSLQTFRDTSHLLVQLLSPGWWMQELVW